MHQLQLNDNVDITTRSKRTRSTFPFGKCKVCNDQATGFHYGGMYYNVLLTLLCNNSLLTLICSS
jgi:hypothetical protein